MNRRLNEEGGCKAVQVSNIDPRVDEALLNQVFSTAGQITSIRIHPDRGGHGGLATATIEFSDHIAAETARATLNTRVIYDYPIRVQWALQSALLTPIGTRKEDTSTHFHLYIGELSQDVDDKTLWNAFAKFGSLSDARIMWDPMNGKSRGYGFVSYRDRADAEKAMLSMTGAQLGKKSLKINWAHQRGAAAVGGGMPTGMDGSSGWGMGGGDENNSRGVAASQPRIVLPTRHHTPLEQISSQTSAAHTTVYVGNIPTGVTADDLRPLFEKYGYIMDVHTHLDKGFIFLKMDSHENAAQAIHHLFGTTVNGQRLRISWGKDKDAEQLFQAQQQYYGSMYSGGTGTAAAAATAASTAAAGYDQAATAAAYAQYYSQMDPQQAAAYYAQYYGSMDPQQAAAYYAQYAQQYQQQYQQHHHQQQQQQQQPPNQ